LFAERPSFIVIGTNEGLRLRRSLLKQALGDRVLGYYIEASAAAN
jgi:MoxR-like ATPase